jgi:hypothetical protein
VGEGQAAAPPAPARSCPSRSAPAARPVRVRVATAHSTGRAVRPPHRRDRRRRWHARCRRVPAP